MSKSVTESTAKPVTRKTVAKNGKSARKAVVVDDLPLEAVEAALEDAILEAAADAAAQVANSSRATALPESDELQEVPFLGPTRVRALAEIGILTLADLREASQAQIGGVKGVGMRNAERIKEWLASQTPEASVESSPVSLDMARASSNQQVQDVFERMGSATTRLKAAIPPKVREKGLDKQLQRLDTVASELAEGPDTLSSKQIEQAVKTLDKIAALLDGAAKPGKVTPKRQSVLTEELRARRKSLEKALD